MVKNTPANAGEVGSIPGSGRSPGGGNGNPPQYSCLGNRMDRGAWQATVPGGSQIIGHDLATKQQQLQYIERFGISILNLHPTTLLSPLISCNNFFVDYIGFFYIGIISSVNEDNEISFFLIWMFLLLFLVFLHCLC